jgi:hypothetical protein
MEKSAFGNIIIPVSPEINLGIQGSATKCSLDLDQLGNQVVVCESNPRPLSHEADTSTPLHPMSIKYIVSQWHIFIVESFLPGCTWPSSSPFDMKMSGEQ